MIRRLRAMMMVNANLPRDLRLFLKLNADLSKTRHSFASTMRACLPIYVFMSAALSLAALIGCNQPNQIDITFDDDLPVLTLRAARWDADLQPTLINGLAIATESEALWEIETDDPTGVPAADLKIPYGELPRGFKQLSPSNRRPRALRPGETYYVGATGPDNAVWRAVFALPVGRYGIQPQPDWLREEDPPKADLSDDE